MLAGGNNNARPNVFASSDSAISIVEMLRGLEFDHYVTRADSAIDFEEQGAWEALSGRLREFAAGKGIKTKIAGDWLSSGAPDGRTLYVGSLKSKTFLRCYEKGKEQGNPLSNWVRVELVVRPEGIQREAAAVASSDDLWGFGKWSRELAPELMEGRIPNAYPSQRRVSKDGATKRFIRMIGQYRVLMGEMLEVLGSEAMGPFVRDCLDSEAWKGVGRADDPGARVPLERGRGWTAELTRWSRG